MSILIKGMEMPSCCMFCPVSNSTGCGLSNPPIIMTSKEMLAGCPDWCPLVPVPPHGRLIDADAMDTSILQAGFSYAFTRRKLRYTPGEVRQKIANAPTIIPAEEDE